MDVIVLVWEDSCWFISGDFEIGCEQLYSDDEQLKCCGYSVVAKSKCDKRVIDSFMVDDMNLEEAKKKAECLVQYVLQDLEQWDCVVGESNRMKVLRIPDLLDEFNEIF